jgi:hypothetical protein
MVGPQRTSAAGGGGRPNEDSCGRGGVSGHADVRNRGYEFSCQKTAHTSTDRWYTAKGTHSAYLYYNQRM